MVSKFGALCTALVASRRYDTLAIAEKLAASDAKREAAVARTAAAEAQLQAQMAIVAEKESQLLHLRSLLGLT